METDENKTIARRYVEMWNTGNLSLADEILSPEYVDHTHPDRSPGPDGVKREIRAFREAFPDSYARVEQMISEGDTVAFRFASYGTHLGTFGPFPPTGKQVQLIGMDFLRIADGKIVELWSVQDTLAWVEQLGLRVQ
ncbi:MAG TPA: ester cyclase [Ktedonobacteraceae bacterium]|jgi:steroid delta-isomerase-like uncharacterized protein|nr:ester cyclase [Ktedonobacteraceae bacterium]